MRYLITGGLGVIGSLIAKSLDSRGNELILVDDGKDRRHEMNDSSFTKSERVGISGSRLGNAYPGESGPNPFGTCDRILHAAASTGIPYSGQAPLDDWSRNVDGTLEVLEAVRANPKPTVILSSVKPYSTAGLAAIERDDHYMLSGSGVNESAMLVPDEPYAASKAAQSLVAQAYARTYDLPIIVFRCSNLYGPAAPHGPRHGWLTWLCIQAALGWPIEIQGSGKQTRDMLFWSDVESAAMAAWEMLEAGRAKGEIFNIGGGYRNMVSVLQAVEVLRSFGANVTTRSAPGRKHEDMLFVTEHSRFTMATGWAPRVSVRDGMADIYQWACMNRDALAVVYAEHGPK